MTEYRVKLLNNEFKWEDLQVCCEFDDDMHMLNYEDYIKLFPSHINDLMILLRDGDNAELIDNTIISDFIDVGWDINELAKYQNDYHCNTTMLISACEWRMYEVMKCLLQQGADVNKCDEFDYNPLITAIIGHSPFYNE